MVFIKFHNMKQEKNFLMSPLNLNKLTNFPLYNKSKQYYNHSSQMSVFFSSFFSLYTVYLSKMFVLFQYYNHSSLMFSFLFFFQYAVFNSFLFLFLSLCPFSIVLHLFLFVFVFPFSFLFFFIINCSSTVLFISNLISTSLSRP